MNEIVFEKDEKTFLSVYSGTFDTPKKLNRSQESISPAIIEDIEKGVITSDTIKELSKTIPVFVYKTCLTIHGNFPVVQRERIGGYKNLIQNNNGSLEVRYNAIDHTLKNEIEKYCIGKFSRKRSSNEDNFSQSYSTTDKGLALSKIANLKSKWENFQFSGMKARVSINGFCYWGCYYVFLTISPLLIDGKPLDIAMQMTGLQESEIMDHISKAAQAKSQEEFKREAAKEKRAIQKAAAIELLNGYKKCAIEATEGNIYIAPVFLVADDCGFVLYRVDKKGSFGRVKLSRYATKDLPTIADAAKFLPYLKGKEVATNTIPHETFLFLQSKEIEAKIAVKPSTERIPLITIESGAIKIVDYSDKAIAVIGDTKPIKDTLKALGGRFNFRLTCGAGWIFPKTKNQELQKALNLI